MRVIALCTLLFACQRADDIVEPPVNADADTDTDTDADSDADTDTDTDTEPDPPAFTERRYDCAGLDPADPAPLGGFVAMTFDDGPHATHTPAIMQVLRDNDVPAAFFVLGDNLAKPALWPIVEEIVADPLFLIANHSWSHAELTSLSTARLIDEIDDTNNLIRTFGVEPAYFRFPYGSSDCDAVDRIVARGQINTGWHIDTADWCYAAVGASGTCTRDNYWRVPSEYESDMRGFIVEQALRFDGGVVLFHDIHAYTASTLQAVIDDLRAEGFTFVHLDDTGAFPLLNAGTPADLPFLGEPCDIVNDQCWQIEYEAWCEPVDTTTTRGVCTLPCEGTCGDRDGAATTFCADAGAGQCVARSHWLNDQCDLVPGAPAASMDRFVGGSSSSPANVAVCAPPHWLD